MTVLRVRNTTRSTSPRSARTAYGKELTVSGKRTSLVHARSACSGVWNQPISHQIESSIHHVVDSRAVRRNHPDQPAGRGGRGRTRRERLLLAWADYGGGRSQTGHRPSLRLRREDARSP